MVYLLYTRHDDPNWRCDNVRSPMSQKSDPYADFEQPDPKDLTKFRIGPIGALFSGFFTINQSLAILLGTKWAPCCHGFCDTFKRWGQMWRHCVRSRRGFASQSQPLLREMFQHILFTDILHRFTMWVKINGNSEPWSRLVNTITVLLRYSLEICCWGWSKSLCPITPWFRPRVCLLFSTPKNGLSENR